VVVYGRIHGGYGEGKEGKSALRPQLADSRNSFCS